MTDRKPILIGHDAIAMISIFTKDCDVLDINWGDMQEFRSKETAESAAKEFVRQLGGHWNGLFMKALKREIDVAMEGYYGPKDE